MFQIFLEQKAKGSGWTQIGEPVTMYSQMPAMIKKDNLSLPSGGTGNAYKYLSRTSYSPTRWISTKDSVASVREDGTITPHSKGSTKLIAQYGDGKGSSGKKYKTKLKLTIN